MNVTNLRAELFSTLNPYLDDENFLKSMLASAKALIKTKDDHRFKPYTMDEVNAMLDEAEARIAAGIYHTDEEVDRWIDEELAEEEFVELAEAV